jgi:hypothetical protein
VGNSDPSGQLVDTSRLTLFGVIAAQAGRAAIAVVVLGAVVTVSITGDIEFQTEATRGKIQAQGHDFADPGKGASVRFNSIGGYPLWAANLDPGRLKGLLTDKQIGNRSLAFAQLQQYLTTKPVAPVLEKSFPTNLNKVSQTQTADCKKYKDCRIDFSLYTGRIF